jgi:hypothetical protein
MKYVLPVFFAAFLVSCGNADDKQVHDTVATVPPSVATISEVQSYRPNIAATPWDGDLNDAIYWRDSRGENAVIVSTRPQYFWEEENPKAEDFFPNDEDPETLSELTEIFVTHFVLKSGEAQWKQFNSYHDYLFGCCDVYMAYQPASLQAMDADSNGTGEVIFMYHETEGDGMIGHSFNGTLVLLIDGTTYTQEGATGLGNQISGTDSLPKGWVNNTPLSPTYCSIMAAKWTELAAKKVEQDRAEVTEQNNVDEHGHADHNH